MQAVLDRIEAYMGEAKDSGERTAITKNTYVSFGVVVLLVSGILSGVGCLIGAVAFAVTMNVKLNTVIDSNCKIEASIPVIEHRLTVVEEEIKRAKTGGI